MEPQSNESIILKYLGYPTGHEPSPTRAPIQFLSQNIRYLPPHLLQLFSDTTTPKQRASVSAIKNRRLRYMESGPAELSFQAARTTWPSLWQGPEIQSQIRAEGKEEAEWAKTDFLGGAKQHVGKLGPLLGEYEEERESERIRGVRRQQREYEEALPEEDEDSDDEEAARAVAAEEPTSEEARDLFLRTIKERFIYGLLDVSTQDLIPEAGLNAFVQSFDYDSVDWVETWDERTDRDGEEQWFAEEEESDALAFDADVEDGFPLPGLDE